MHPGSNYAIKGRGDGATPGRNEWPTEESPMKFDIKVGGRTYGFDLTSAPEQMKFDIVKQGVAILLQRCTAQGVADGDKLTDTQKAEKEAKLAAELNAGTWTRGSGGGGETLTPLDIEERDLFKKFFIQNGRKSTEAALVAARTKPADGKVTRQDAFAEIIKKAMFDAGRTDAAEVEKVTNLNYAKIMNDAKRLAAAKIKAVAGFRLDLPEA